LSSISHLHFKHRQTAAALVSFAFLLIIFIARLKIKASEKSQESVS